MSYFKKLGEVDEEPQMKKKIKCLLSASKLPIKEYLIDFTLLIFKNITKIIQKKKNLSSCPVQGCQVDFCWLNLVF
jgi:hypothetical protein